MFKKMSAGLVTLTAVAVVIYVRFLRPWYLRWGATDEEVEQLMPGDEEVSQVNYQSTRAITIKARAASIWPWLMQMGQGRGGLYSYDRLENLMGIRISNVDQILAEFQHLKVGISSHSSREGVVIGWRRSNPLHCWCWSFAPQTEVGWVR